MTEFDDSPVYSRNDLTDWIPGALLAIGAFLLLALLACLYYFGAFHYLADILGNMT